MSTCDKDCNSQTCDLRSGHESQTALNTKTDQLTDRELYSDLGLGFVTSALMMEKVCPSQMLASDMAPKPKTTPSFLENSSS
jgi:hypothetical protein